MKISTSSWHYQFIIGMLGETPPDNLCPYVRRLFLAMFTATAMLAAASLVAFFALSPLMVGLFALISGLPPFHDAFIVFPAAVALVGYAMILAALLVSLVVKACRALLASQEPQEPKEPNVFVEYLKAKHEKICPRLEFEVPNEVS